jgi:MerC mercury resistance protein
MIKRIKFNKADLIGIISSSICLVHCLATPLLIGLGMGFISNPFFKYSFLVISFVSIYKATENISNKKIISLLWVSFLGFLFSSILQEEHHWLHYSEYLFALLIILGHILNIRYCRSCVKQDKNEN